jgi:hypothetical protein
MRRAKNPAGPPAGFSVGPPAWLLIFPEFHDPCALSSANDADLALLKSAWEPTTPQFVDGRRITINEETPMRKILSVAAAAGLLFGAPALCLAQGGAQDSAPGQKMQDKGSVRGQPGASGYAPGQRMQDKGSKPGQPGASGYAPGQQDSTSGQGSRSGGTNPGTSKTR